MRVGELPTLFVSGSSPDVVDAFRWSGRELTRVDTIATGRYPSAVATTDLDGDGYGDLVVAASGDDLVEVFWGNASGFGHPTILATGREPKHVAIADFDGDGHLDIAVAIFGQGSIKIYYGRSSRTFELGETVSLTVAPWGLTAVDLDRDGKTDLAWVSYSEGTMHFARNNGPRAWHEVESYKVTDHPRDIAAIVPSTSSPVTLVIVDENKLFIYRVDNRAHVSLTEQRYIASNTRHVCVGDVDGDEISDVIISSEGKIFAPNTETTSEWGRFQALRGKKDGGYSEIETISPPTPAFNVVVGDFDGNGSADVVGVSVDGLMIARGNVRARR